MKTDQNFIGSCSCENIETLKWNFTQISNKARETLKISTFLVMMSYEHDRVKKDANIFQFHLFKWIQKRDSWKVIFEEILNHEIPESPTLLIQIYQYKALSYFMIFWISAEMDPKYLVDGQSLRKTWEVSKSSNIMMNL